MSRIEELINRLCPDGVEFKKLGEVCDFVNGFAFKSSLFKNIGLPIIRITNINGISINMDDLKFFDAKDYNINLQTFKIEKGDILIAMSGATTGKIGCYNNNNIAYINQRVGKFVPNNSFLENRYLFHFLRSKTNELYIMAGGGAQPNLSSIKLLNNFSIPIPPLEIQQEIVRILDNFTELTNELTNELTARKKQYEYYRDKLLTFDKDDDKVKWMKLGEIGTFIRGNGLQKKDFTETGFPCIHYGQIHTHYGTSTDSTISYTSYALAEKLRKASYGNLIIATTSEDVNGVCKACAWLGKTDVAVSGDAYIYRHNQNPKYISYMFQTKLFYEYKKRAATGTKVIRVSGESMNNFVIPIPSLETQQHIVSILDRFDQLCNDLTAGLPAEIEARRKQYEYYRDKLLTFKEKKA